MAKQPPQAQSPGDRADAAPQREFVAVWRHRLKAGRTGAFMRAHGPGGSWENLFRKSEDYLGTELLQDNSDPLLFVTIDRWKSAKAYNEFRTANAAGYLALDTICSDLTEDEELIAEGSRP